MVDSRHAHQLEELTHAIEIAMSKNMFFAQILIEVNSSTVTDVRRAARRAGERMGWRVGTHVHGDRLLVVDRNQFRDYLTHEVVHESAEVDFRFTNYPE